MQFEDADPKKMGIGNKEGKQEARFGKVVRQCILGSGPAVRVASVVVPRLRERAKDAKSEADDAIAANEERQLGFERSQPGWPFGLSDPSSRLLDGYT